MTALSAPYDGGRGLPQELYDAIIAFLHDDLLSLRCCALATRRFLPNCQKIIFNSLRISTRKSSFDIPEAKFIFIHPIRLASILRKSPHLARFVRNLAVVSSLGDAFLPINKAKWRANVRSLVFCLRQFHHLECFSIGPSWEPRSAWEDPEFVQAVQNIVTLPSLRGLDCKFSYDMVCSRMSYIDHLSFTADTRENLTAPNTHPIRRQLCTVDSLKVRQVGRGTSLRLVSQIKYHFDITNLKTLYVVSPGSLHLPTNMICFLRVCGKNLVNLVLDLVAFGGVIYNILDFSLEDLSSLRKLHVKHQGRTFVHFLLDLVNLLATLPVGSMNVLEDLLVQTNRIASEEDYLPKPWDDLWDLVTDSSRFPRLTKLYLRIFYPLDSEDKTAAVKAAWKAHLLNKEFDSDRLSVRIEVLDHGDTFKELHPFWPNKEFDRLFSIC